MKTSSVSADWIVKALTSGRFAERIVAQGYLDGEVTGLDRRATRDKLIQLIKGDYSPKREEEDRASHLSDVRCWLLSSLGRMPAEGEEPASTLRNHVDGKFEPNAWARYWALTALIRLKPADLKDICDNIEKQDTEPLPRMLAVAVLAQGGDHARREAILGVLADQSETPDVTRQKWAALRAVRFVYLASAFESISSCVENPKVSDLTYDALGALGNVPPDSPYAEKAGLTLVKFITLYRRYSFWDAMRIRAIESLGLLRNESTAYLLLEELTDFNPAVASVAAGALEATLGPATTVTRVLEVLVKRGDQELPRFARGLREMRDQKAIVEVLGTVLVAHGGAYQEYAQRLLSEIGGASAFEKLRSLTKSTERYLAVLDRADEKLRELFEATVKEARTGFWIVMIMDVIIFLVGVALMVISAMLALQESNPSKSWATWITGSGGVLATIYGRFFAQPRAQVEDSVRYLSGLKAVFLGYLRQLRQTDQAYTRRIFEDKPLTPEETRQFNDLIEQTMDRARKHLTEKLSGVKTDQGSSTKPSVPPTNPYEPSNKPSGSDPTKPATTST